MKIFEVIPQLSSGGAERFVVDLCNELSEKHEVTLVVLHSVEKFGFYRDELSSKVKVVSMNKRMGFDMSLMWRMMWMIKEEKPDIVHTHLNGVVYTALSAVINRRVVHCHTVHRQRSWFFFCLPCCAPDGVQVSSVNADNDIRGITAQF